MTRSSPGALRRGVVGSAPRHEQSRSEEGEEVYAGQLRRLRRVLRGCPQARGVPVEDHQATIELATDDDRVHDLLQQLVKQGLGVRSDAEKEPSLECEQLTRAIKCRR